MKIFLLFEKSFFDAIFLFKKKVYLKKVLYLYLSLSHVGKVLNNSFTKIFQSLELNLQGLQFGCFAKTLIGLGLNTVLRLQENLVTATTHTLGYAGYEANLVHVVLVCGE